MPASFGHYVENTGNTTLHFLEIFNTDRFQDISLAQVGFVCIWLPFSCYLRVPAMGVWGAGDENADGGLALQWLALTPPDLVKAHLDLDDETIAALSKTKKTVVGPSNSTIS